VESTGVNISEHVASKLAKMRYRHEELFIVRVVQCEVGSVRGEVSDGRVVQHGETA